MSSALGGAIYGFIIKQFPTLPTVPMLGQAGTVALAAYFFGGKHKIIGDVGVAAAAIAGFQLGSEGHIHGEVTPQIHGIASQV